METPPDASLDPFFSYIPLRFCHPNFLFFHVYFKLSLCLHVSFIEPTITLNDIRTFFHVESMRGLDSLEVLSFIFMSSGLLAELFVK